MSRVARARLFLAHLLLALFLVGGGARAWAQEVLQRGDAAVTGFSGTKPETNIPDDVHPLDRTFIDLDGASVRIFGLSDLGTAPRGQVSDVPALRDVKAGEVGQVFGIALGDRPDGRAPDIYVTATSMYGLQIVAADGKGGFDRLLQGAKGAQFMPGQFGKDGTPGSIYKIDGVSGAVSLFADVRTDDQVNSGPALGNIAYDAKSKQLFVSDLETGLIHRITLDGKDRDTYDHGEIGRKAAGLDAVSYDPNRRMSIESPAFDGEDSATWGFADERRRVFGVGVSRERLYYAVAEGPSIWSVSIDDEGDFGNDPRIELDVPNSPPGTNITSITFDGAGMMYLAQRGAVTGSYDYTAFANAQSAKLVRYRWDDKEGRWSKVPEEYAVGLGGDYRSTLGGVALNYGYDKFGRIDYGRCRQTVWTTGEHLREGADVARVSTGGAKTLHGLQGMYKSRVRPQNEPPYESWFTDYNGLEDDPATYGQVGAIAIYAPCDGAASEPAQGAPLVTPEIIGIEPPADDPGIIIDKRCFGGVPGGKVRCKIDVKNVMDQAPGEDVVIKDLTKVLVGPDAGDLVPVVAVDVPFPAILCSATPTPDFACTIPAALLSAGVTISIEVWVDTHDLTLNGNVGFRNCAKINHPNGFGKACAEGGADIVVEKIGPGTCDAGGTCKFGLRIANVGSMPFSGDVLLADAMFIGGGAPAVPVTSVTPPIACSAGDTAQLPFTCQTSLSLMPGEDHIHWVEVTMPAPGGYEAENCFGALDPTLIAIGPVPPGLFEAGTGNPSCVTVVVPAPAPAPIEKKEPPEQVQNDPPITLIKLPRCEDGRSRRADGTCPCPKGTVWSAREHQCLPLRQRCADPDRRRDDGSCCPYGTYFDAEDGRCRAPDPGCPDPERRKDDGSCCPRGTVVSDNGDRCVGIETACPIGTRWNYNLDTCVPLRPMCDFGERFDWRLKICRPVHEHCPRGSVFNTYTRECDEGGQACPAGTHWSRKRWKCVTDETRPECPDGSPRLANGACRCPLNRRWNEAMQSCGGGHTPGQCKPGERFVNGKCIRLTDDPGLPVCPVGQHRLGKICVPNQPVDEGCPAGKHRVGRLCVTDTPPETTVPCPAGQYRVGKLCVPERDHRPPRDLSCPDGQMKVGSRCIPRRVIKDPPQILPKKDLPKVDVPPKRLPDPPKVKIKPELPKVKIRPETPKVNIKPEVPKVKIKPDVPKVRIKPEVPKIKTPSFNPKLNAGPNKFDVPGKGKFTPNSNSKPNIPGTKQNLQINIR